MSAGRERGRRADAWAACAAFASLLGCAGHGAITEAEVHAMLDEQAADWNRGDLAAFVRSYWDDPGLTFLGSDGLTRGRADLLARYEENYATPEARGRLAFELLDLRQLGHDAAVVLGRYQLTRSPPASGFFTLVVERRGGELVITHDHSSAARR
jgi:uncharacterized protein (TIGR02246 family)